MALMGVEGWKVGAWALGVKVGEVGKVVGAEGWEVRA